MNRAEIRPFIDDLASLNKGALLQSAAPLDSPTVIGELKRSVSYHEKMQHVAQEELIELREENAQLKLENELYQMRLRCGIKKVTFYLRDSHFKTLETLAFNKKGIECYIEIEPQMGKGEYRYAHEYKVIAGISGKLPKNFEFSSGIIKYYREDRIPSSESSKTMSIYDCQKQWYLSDMATKFATALGLNPNSTSVPKFLPCAHVKFPDGEYATVEPKLDEFDRITDNLGGGVEDMSDILASYAHYTFVTSGGKYLPCDFQGDETHMILTDPEVNTWGENEEFLGIENNGKHGVQLCLSYHLQHNCESNKYCIALKLAKTKL